jgi:hypothetical protein
MPGHAGDPTEASDGLIAPGVTPVVVASHRRSGTHLMLDLLRRHFEACRPPFRFGVNPHRYLYFVLDRLRPTHRHHVGVEAGLRFMRSTSMPTLKTHSTPEFSGMPAQAKALCEECMERGIVLYCVRDVRAVLASLHAFEAVSDPDLRMSLSDYLRQEVNGKLRPQIWADHIRAWIDFDPEPNIIYYEDVMAHPRAMVEQLSEWLDQPPRGINPVLPPKLRFRQRLWLARISGVPESTNVMGRKLGIKPQNWRTVYTASDIELLEEHAGDVMRRLGYLQGRDWASTSRPDALGL